MICLPAMLANSPFLNLVISSPPNLERPSDDFLARMPSPVFTQSLNLFRTRLNCRNSLNAALSLLILLIMSPGEDKECWSRWASPLRELEEGLDHNHGFVFHQLVLA